MTEEKPRLLMMTEERRKELMMAQVERMGRALARTKPSQQVVDARRKASAEFRARVESDPALQDEMEVFNHVMNHAIR